MSSSSSTLHPVAASHPHHALSIPIFSTNHRNSLSLPLKSFNFTLSYNPKNPALVSCVPQKETVEVAEEEVRWENEESDVEQSDEEVLVEEEEAEVFSDEAKVFVGNLSYDVDSEQLAEIFGRAGVVEIAEVIYNRETNQSRGFAFVTMSTVMEAEKAVEMFNRYDVNGRLLTVSKAAPKGEARPERITRVFDTVPRIYVGNLPWTIDNERLEQIFNEHGKVVEARIVYDSETGRSRGFGFVTLSTENEVQNAIGALDGQSLEGRSIRVNVAETRPARRF